MLTEIKELPKRFLRAKTVRVKHVAATHIAKGGWGLRCHGNYKAWAGEVAEVYTQLLEGNGWDQLQLVAEFPHFRFVTLAELVLPHDESPTADLTHGVWRVGITLGDDLDLLVPIWASPHGVFRRRS